MDKHTHFFWSRVSSMSKHTCKLEQSKESVVFKDVKYMNPRECRPPMISLVPFLFKQFYWGLNKIQKSAHIILYNLICLDISALLILYFIHMDMGVRKNSHLDPFPSDIPWCFSRRNEFVPAESVVMGQFSHYKNGNSFGTVWQVNLNSIQKLWIPFGNYCV